MKGMEGMDDMKHMKGMDHTHHEMNDNMEMMNMIFHWSSHKSIQASVGEILIFRLDYTTYI